MSGPRIQPRARHEVVGLPLSPTERRVYALIGRGLCNKEICRELGIAMGTAKVHVSQVLGKTGARDRVKAALRYHGLEI